jgi:hypothetical protein
VDPARLATLNEALNPAKSSREKASAKSLKLQTSFSSGKKLTGIEHLKTEPSVSKIRDFKGFQTESTEDYLGLS